MNSVLTMIAGLGLFLYAMQQVEQAVQTLFSEKASDWLQRSTNTTAKGVVAGAIVTAIMQSSSLVGLLVLAFVSVRVLPLRHAMAVMLGANLGTTVTGWLVTLLGFKLSLSSVSLPLAGVGALCFVLLPKGAWRSVGWFLLAFGLLVFGLDTMKVAVEGVGQRFDVSWLQGYPLVIYLLAGVALTAIIQSSSAAMLITLSALNGGLIALPEALALVIGADLGTTSTLLLGAIKGSVQKKQVAAFHVLYNVGTALMAFLLIMPLWPRFAGALGISDPLYGLVAFHTSFNFIGIVVFAPFLGAMEKAIETHIGKRGHQDLFADISPQSVEPALLVLTRESETLIERVRDYCQHPLRGRSLARFYEEYDQVTDQEMQLADYANRLAQQPMSPGQEQRLRGVRWQVREAVYALKSLKDVADDLALLASSRDPGLRAFRERVHDALDRLYQHPAGTDLENRHRLAMEALHRQAYALVADARAQGISVLNLAREVDESGRHWLRSLTVADPVSAQDSG